MSIVDLLLGAVLVGALGVIVWRWGMAHPLPAMVRTFVGVFSGAATGFAVGAVSGVVLGMFVGMNPGTSVNEQFIAVALGFMGVVGGALGGLMYMQRLPG